MRHWSRLAFGLAMGAFMVVAACNVGGPPPSPPPRVSAGQAYPLELTPAPNVAGDPLAGRRLFADKGCGACHTLRGVPGASGVVGPNLTNVALRPTLAGEAMENSPATMARWILDPPVLKPGTGMPKMGLTDQEAEAVTAFLYSQPYNPTR